MTVGEVEYYIEHSTTFGNYHQPDTSMGWGLINANNAVNSLPTYCTTNFNDISGNVFTTDILFLACGGVMSGVGGGAFGPSQNVTRAQLAKILCLAYGVATFTPGSPTFTDVPSSYWAYQYIEAVNHVGIMNGIGGGLFSPNAAVTRGQLAVTIYRARKYLTITSTPTGGQEASFFRDVLSTDWDFNAIETIHYAGITNGDLCNDTNDHCFRPNDNIRRDEISSMIAHAIRRVTNPTPTNTPIGNRPVSKHQ